MQSNQTYETATGKIDFTLKNNYMFQFVLQNIDILKALLCSLLDLDPGEILTIEILNPISLGDSFNAKEFIMDIRIMLNNNQHINIEMQVEDEGNWPDRSLSYLCRSFDNLMSGQNYKDVLAAIHISIIDFTLFPDQPEFYSDNRLMNVKTHKIYDDKFRLRVLSLRQIQNATPEDKAAERDKWAELFRATTWEELKMIAAQDPSMTAAAQKLYTANSDYIARERARTLEDNLRKERWMREQLEENLRKEQWLHEQLEVSQQKEQQMHEQLEESQQKEQQMQEQLEASQQKEQQMHEQLNEQAAIIAELRTQLAQVQKVYGVT